MNRRTLLKGTGGLAAAMILHRRISVFAQATPTNMGLYPNLTITVRDDGYDYPKDLTAGRYAVSIVNDGTFGTHTSLGRLPDGVTNDQVMADMSKETDEDPDWFVKAGYVGLPDWGAPGETRTGVVDLVAGNYFMFDPFSDQRHALFSIGEGTISDTAPHTDLTVEETEMRFILPESGLTSGSYTMEIKNIGAIAHEFQVVAVPEGTTVDDMVKLFSLPFDATPTPDFPLSSILADYHPAAAASILAAGRTCWIDVDIDPGTYAVLCAVPFPGGTPHAMQGMMEIVTIA